MKQASPAPVVTRPRAGHDTSLDGAVMDRLQRLVRSGMPKYVALKDAVLQGIAAGALRPGTRLPTESELVAAVGLSLGTVQRALRMLVDEGAVVRRPGDGSYIADRQKEMEAPLHCRFLDDESDGFLTVYSDVLDRDMTAEPGPWTKHLGASNVLRIDRSLEIGGQFKVYSRFYVDPAVFPIFREATIRKLAGANFKSLIAQSAGVAVNRVRQYVSFVAADRKLKALLGCKEGEPVAKFELYAYAGSATPAYYQELYAPPFAQRLLVSGD
jgi:DNA-binding GntR family transcriptional regulator